jgi:dTDP-4-dehydrorhamnose 3,5-epimerase
MHTAVAWNRANSIRPDPWAEVGGEIVRGVGESPYTDPSSAEVLIQGVVVRALRVNRDQRGTLVETLRGDWTDCFSEEHAPFAQTYYSVTKAWVARDEDRWHVHQHQMDRFVVPLGDIVLALHDPRPHSPTRGRLNLLRLGQRNGDSGQILVAIPPQIHHAFMVIGDEAALLINYPTRLFDPADEGRVPFVDASAVTADGHTFSWDYVRRLERRECAPGARAEAK